MDLRYWGNKNIKKAEAQDRGQRKALVQTAAE